MRGTWHVAEFGNTKAYRAQKPADKTPMAFYYAVLGITDNADLATVKQAFRTLAKQYHPDINRSREAAFRMKEINDAYRRLSRYLDTTP
jgi:DnaJ-domain-containing protein 1